MDTTTQIAEYSVTEAALAELRGQYVCVVFDVSNGKGMQAAKDVRAVLRGHRVNLEKKRVELKAPALEHCRFIDTEAKRIAAELSALEDPIDEQIKAEEARKEAEKAERKRKEDERVAAVRAKIDAIRNLPLDCVGKGLADIDQAIADAEAFSINEFAGAEQLEAGAVKASTLSKLRTVRDLEEAAQGERERLAAERAELDRQKAAQEALQREHDRIAAERRAEEDRAAQAERERLAAVAEAERAERARVDADEHAKLKAEQDRVRAEQARIDEEKAAPVARKRAAAETKYLANLRRGATLLGAAIDAYKFLTAKGYVDIDITLTLGFAIEKETQKEAA